MLILITAHFLVAVLTPLLCKLLGHRSYFVLAVVPAAAAGWLLAQGPVILSGGVVTEEYSWIPHLGVSIALRLGLVQWVLGLIVTVIGALVLHYCRWYFSEVRPRPRSAGVLVAFAGAMLGLVTADDLIVLYVCWELTTVFSYLLIGHDNTRRANRAAATTALVVTTAGGLAMLVGILSLGFEASTFRLSEILAQPPTGVTVVAAAVLILVGALTKSAQVPFHFWLPGAMAAPTPISAYLHAAAMVKAGIYLIMVVAPLFAEFAVWRILVGALGGLTMVLGGWRSLRQTDLKLVLAYGTVSQLGFMVLLTGLGTRATALAGLTLVVAHAVFKAALFLVVGIVDHSTGTRDLRELSGVGRRMPVVTVAAILAGASMAGIPPLFGFLTKESALESVVYLLGDGGGTGASPVVAVLLVGVVVLGSVLTVAYTLRFLWGAFADKRGVARPEVRRVPFGFAAVPVLLAGLSLVGGFAGPQVTVAFTPYAEQFGAGDPSHGLALWHGFTVPLALSVTAITLGCVLFWQRERIAAAQATFPDTMGADVAYQKTMRLIDRLAVEATARVQRGSLAVYVGTILLTLITLVGGSLVFTRSWPDVMLADNAGQLAVGVIIVVAAVLTAGSRGRIRAILLLGVTGYGTALLFLLHGGVDLALTQMLVETVTLVVFLLVVRKLPKYFTDRPLHSSRWWRLVIAIPAGATVAATVLLASGNRTAEPVSTGYYEAAYNFGYGKNIVNVILVDTRAWDTLGEISVLAIAATGVASLVFLRTRTAQITRVDPGALRKGGWLLGALSMSRASRSLIFEVSTRILFSIAMIVSVYLLFAGHNFPGGGFAGGLVAGMALVLRYLAGGKDELNEAAPFDAGRLLGAGLLVVVATALAPVVFGGKILQSFDAYLTIPGLESIATPLGEFTLLGQIHVVSSTAFDIGVYLVVLGVLLDLVRSLGAGLDQHEETHAAPIPEPESTRALPGTFPGGRR